MLHRLPFKKSEYEMNAMNWYDFIPSIMSAIATVAAAYAAFKSLQISREAKNDAKQSALAVHHRDAAIALTSAEEKLQGTLNVLSEIAYSIWAEWPSQIENLDNRDAGGVNPRPLRHVLSDASEMLSRHGIRQGNKLTYAARSMYAIVRNGINNLNDAEYKELLKRADGEYCDFEGVFGSTKKYSHITEAPAFRWACHQLNRRINKDRWLEIWGEAWKKDGWLYKYRSEFKSIEPILKAVLSNLKSERTKLEYTVFPLESNKPLLLKYDNMMISIEALLEDCSLDLVGWYSDNTPHKEDAIPLILYTMGIAYLTMEIYGKLGISFSKP